MVLNALDQHKLRRTTWYTVYLLCAARPAALPIGRIGMKIEFSIPMNGVYLGTLHFAQESESETQALENVERNIDGNLEAHLNYIWKSVITS